MVKQVTRWLSEDGREFDSEEQALAHEQKKARTEDVRRLLQTNFSLTTYDEVCEDVDDLAEWIVDNFVKKEA